MVARTRFVVPMAAKLADTGARVFTHEPFVLVWLGAVVGLAWRVGAKLGFVEVDRECLLRDVGVEVGWSVVPATLPAESRAVVWL